MNRDEYLDLLKLYLKDLPSDEIDDILLDYEEHFRIGISKGKSEEEISKELGSPKDIAQNYQGVSLEVNSSQIPYNESPKDNSRKFLIGLLLIFFNLIIVLGPFMAGVGILITFYLTAFTFVVGGAALILGFPVMLFLPSTQLHFLTTISIGIGLIGLGILVIILLLNLTKLLFKLLIRYFNWNIDLINK